jgi:uncharacterized UBP type Zn finger protein
MSESDCPHIEQADINIRPHSKGCEQCLAMGDTWVHLRVCLQCGQVGCCDSSKNKHASTHARTSKHPMVRSLEPGEHWAWCFVDDVGFELPAR